MTDTPGSEDPRIEVLTRASATITVPPLDAVTVVARARTRRRRRRGLGAAGLVVAAVVAAVAVAGLPGESVERPGPATDAPTATPTATPTSTPSCEAPPIDLRRLEAEVLADPSRRIEGAGVPPGFMFSDDVRVTFAGRATLRDLDRAGINGTQIFTRRDVTYSVVVMKFTTTRAGVLGPLPTAPDPGGTRMVVVQVTDPGRPGTGHTVGGVESDCFRA